MAAITKYTASLPGIAVTMGAAASNDTIDESDGRDMLLVTNGSGGSITVTIPAVTTSRPGDSNFPTQTVADISNTISAGATELMGPFPAAYRNATGAVAVNYSATPSVTRAVLRLP